MDSQDELIRRIVTHEMGQVTQSQQNSADFEKRIIALNLERDNERTSARIVNSTNLVARTIPSVVSQQSGFYDTNIGIMGRLEKKKMHTKDELIRKIVVHKMEQAAQSQQNSIDFEKRIVTLRLERDYERTSARIHNSTHLVARVIPSVVSQHSHQHPGLYDTSIGIMGRQELMQNEKYVCDLRNIHNSNPSENNTMTPPLRSILSCCNCGRWPFPNHVELLLHENLCSVNFMKDTMIPQRHVPNNQTLIRYSINQDTVSDINMSLTKGTVCRSTHVPSSLPMRSSTSTRTPENSQEGTSSVQISDSLSIGIPYEEWVTPLQHFVSRHCAEFFIVSTSDIYLYSSKVNGHVIHAGLIGIRCPYCHKIEDENKSRTNSKVEVNEGRMYFPHTIASIYSTTLDLLQHHTPICDYVPQDILKQYNTLNTDDISSSKSRQYWIECARSLGLADTSHGIQSSSRTSLMIPSESGMLPPVTLSDPHLMIQKTNALSSIVEGKRALFRDIEGGPLVDPKYKHLATDYSYTLMSQVQSCTFLESDRRNKLMNHPIGFPGLACSHCYNEHGCGRFFRSNIKTMSDTSKTLDVLLSHMLRCKQCPIRVKVRLQTLRLKHDKERSDMRFGSQKAFFVCIWKKLHGEMPSDTAKTMKSK